MRKSPVRRTTVAVTLYGSQRMKYPRTAVLAFASTVCLLFASSAQAYCRATTVDTAALCPSACDTSGLPLYWATRKHQYVFNFRGFPGVSDALMRDAFRRAFAQWEAIQCDGTPSGFSFTPDPGVTALTAGPLELQPDKNVMVHYSEREWLDRHLPPKAYALTALWFDIKTGEIVDADIQFNGGLGPFVICPDSGCAAEQVDLINVATHEVGHLIGLGHSEVAGSSMWCSAPPTDVGKRQLSDDDRRGFCAIYPQGESEGGELPEGIVARGSGACGIAVAEDGGRAAPIGALLVLLLLLTQRRRRLSRAPTVRT